METTPVELLQNVFKTQYANPKSALSFAKMRVDYHCRIQLELIESIFIRGFELGRQEGYDRGLTDGSAPPRPTPFVL